jgi:hypothetical protein
MCRSVTNFFLSIPMLLGQVPTMAPPGTYAYWVQQATRKLRFSTFGDWKGVDNSGGAQTPDEANDKYDKMYWLAAQNEIHTIENSKLKINYVRYLKLKIGKAPAEAIDAIFERLEEWKIDCDLTVQIANLYALRMILGAAGFNSRAGPQMELRSRESPALKTVLHYGRDGPGEKWRNVLKYEQYNIEGIPDPDGRVTIEKKGPFTYAPGTLNDTTEELLGRTPPGSRVRWTNGRALLSDEFRHENCVKLGNNLYAAGGLIDAFTGNEFTRERLEVRFANSDKPDPKYVYIDEIEIFGL